MALATAVLTAAAAAALGGEVWHVSYAAVYVALTLAAVFSPGAITLPVIAGQVLAASLLLQPDGPAPLLLVPVVASLVLTAELLGLAARLDGPVAPDATPGLPRAVSSAFLAGGSYAAVVGAGAYSGLLGGLVAVSMGAGVCVLLAVLLVRSAGVADR